MKAEVTKKQTPEGKCLIDRFLPVSLFFADYDFIPGLAVRMVFGLLSSHGQTLLVERSAMWLYLHGQLAGKHCLWSHEPGKQSGISGWRAAIYHLFHHAPAQLAEPGDALPHAVLHSAVHPSHDHAEAFAFIESLQHFPVPGVHLALGENLSLIHI